MWDFDSIEIKIIFKREPEIIFQEAIIDLGSGDLSIDTGTRENNSVIDQGNRVSGNI